MPVELVRDGRATRYRPKNERDDVPWSHAVFREPHELWQRVADPTWLPGARKLVRLYGLGTAEIVDLEEMLDKAGDDASRKDLLEGPARLLPGEACEVFYVEVQGATTAMGHRLLARLA